MALLEGEAIAGANVPKVRTIAGRYYRYTYRIHVELVAYLIWRLDAWASMDEACGNYMRRAIAFGGQRVTCTVIGPQNGLLQIPVRLSFSRRALQDGWEFPRHWFVSTDLWNGFRHYHFLESVEAER